MTKGFCIFAPRYERLKSRIYEEKDMYVAVGPSGLECLWWRR
jgi:hypothetical protein